MNALHSGLWAVAVLALATPLEAGPPRAATTTVSDGAQSDLWVAKRRRKKRKKRDKAPKPAASPVETTPAPADLPPPPPLPENLSAVAVLPLRGQDVTDELLHAVEVALLREIDESGKRRGVSPLDVAGHLQGVGLSAACNNDIACTARAGRYAAAHFALETHVAALGGTISISMRLIDTVAVREVSRVADPVSEDPQQRAKEIHRLAVQLLSPETYVGSLRIVCTEPDAEVYVDDKLVGKTPLATPIDGMRAGPHILRLSKPGFADLWRFVDVVYKRSATIEIDLNNTTVAGVIVEQESKTGFGSLFVATDVAGIEIRVDGEPRGMTVLDAAIEKVAAGKRRLSLHKEGMETHAEEIEVEVGQRTDIRMPDAIADLTFDVDGIVEAAAPLPGIEVISATTPRDGALGVGTTATEVRGPTWRFYTGAVVAGLGVVGLSASGYFGSVVDTKAGEAAAIVKEAEGGVSASDYGRLQDSLDTVNSEGEQAEKNQWITLGAGSTLAVVGGAMVLWDMLGWVEQVPAPSEEAPAAAAVSWVPVSGGGLVVVGGRF